MTEGHEKPPTIVTVSGEEILLGQLLQVAGVVASGGQAKAYLAQNPVRVNGSAEQRRGRKVHAGDVVDLPDGRRLLPRTADQADDV